MFKWDKATVYDLKPMDALVMAGPSLRLVTRFLETAGRRMGLMNKLATDAGFHKLRGMHLPEPPTFLPTDTLACEAAVAAAGVAAPPSSAAAAAASAQLVASLVTAKRPASAFVSAMDLHEAYKARTTTPVQVAEHVVSAIEFDAAQDKPVGAMYVWLKDEIMAQARASTDRYAQGKQLGPLDGVPVAVKDEADAVPYATGGGTTFLKTPATADADSVARLRSAGAIIIGKTRMHELGVDVTNCNPGCGTSRNPYNVDHFTGGSSGGSAAAVAAGLCPIAIGADGGGSIRIPAAYTGVFGLKPTAGRISSRGSLPLAVSVGVVGPIGATAHDLALSYALIAGPNPDDVTAKNNPATVVKDFDKASCTSDTNTHLACTSLTACIQQIESLAGIRIGVYWPYFEDADPVIVAACKAALDKLVERGATLVEIAIPDLSLYRICHVSTILSEVDAYASSLPKSSKLGAGTRLMLLTATALTPSDYIKAQQIRTRGMDLMRRLYKDVDVIVTPTTAILPPKIVDGALTHGYSNYSEASKAMQYIFFGNFLGLPAVTVPVGYAEPSSLPIGMQFMGKWWDENLLLRLANATEHVLSKERRPASLYSKLI
ncbi:gatA1 protein [Entophlyctis helioformis]|nr:gatA1 protein [Entophlyctis helioformis]